MEEIKERKVEFIGWKFPITVFLISFFSSIIVYSLVVARSGAILGSLFAATYFIASFLSISFFFPITVALFKFWKDVKMFKP